MQFQKSGLKPSCQTIPSLRITRGLARTTHGKLVWMPEKYAQQFWGCQEKRQRSCASVSGRSKFGNPKGIRLTRGARSDTQKVTDEGISYEPYGRDQQVECRTGVQLPTGVEQLPNWDVFLFPAKKGSPGDTPGPWGENITGTLFQTAVLELNQLFTICYSPIQLVERGGAPWGRDKEQPSPLDQRYIIKHLSLEPLALVDEQ